MGEQGPSDDAIREVPVAAVRLLPIGRASRVAYASLACYGLGIAVTPVESPGLTLLLLGAATALFFAVFFVARPRRYETRSVLVRRGALRFAEGLAEVPPNEVLGGRAERGNVVRIETRAGEWVLEPAAGTTSTQLLDELGLDVGGIPLRISVSQPVVYLGLWFVGLPVGACAACLVADRVLRMSLGLAPHYGTVAWTVMVLVVALLVVLTVRLRTTVVVGADGVLVRALLPERVYGFEQLAGARAEGTKLVLLLKNGGERRLFFSVDYAYLCVPLAERINATLAVRRANTLAESALPARAGRSVAEWRGVLGDVGGQTSGYRVAAIDAGTLRSVVANAKADIEQRVAAVMVLAQQGDRELGERVRVAAGATVSERVRVALEHAADGSLEEGELEAAVREDERAKGQRRG